jgi:hypothetical protein
MENIDSVIYTTVAFLDPIKIVYKQGNETFASHPVGYCVFRRGVKANRYAIETIIK